MGKIVKSALVVAAVAALTVATGSTGTWLGSALGNLTGSAFSGFATGSASILGLSGTLGAAVAGAAIGAGLSVLGSVLAPKPADMGQQAGAKVPVTNSIDTRKIIYGKARVAGAEIFIEEYDTDGGNDTPNDTIVFARIVADHPIESFGDFWLGDTNLGNVNATSNGTYGNKLQIKTYDGSAETASSDSWLAASHTGWDEDHKGQGLSYYVVKALFDQELFPYGAGELRRCSFEVKGKKIYDMRKDSTYAGGDGAHRMDEQTTWEYSTNPALCLLDYLRDDMLNNPVDASEIDLESFRAAAEICDEKIRVKNVKSGDLTDSDGAYIHKYTMNGIIDGGRSKWENIQLMLTAMSGRIMWSGGKIKVFAGEVISPDFQYRLDNDDIISASYVPMPATGQRYNEVRGTFMDVDARYEVQDFPAIARDAATQAQEGTVIFNLNLPFCQDIREAQRHAKIALEMSRQPVMQITTLPVGMAFQPMDVVLINRPNLGLEDDEAFRVLEQTIKPGTSGEPLTVTMTLIKEDGSIYGWDADTEEKDKTELPSLSQPTGLETAAPSGVSVDPITIADTDGTETAALAVSWNTPHPTVAATRVDVRPNGITDWIAGNDVLKGDTNTIVLVPERTRIDVRVYHIHTNGSYGAETILLDTLSDDVAGSGTIDWGDIGDPDGTKPDDYADVTADALLRMGVNWGFNGGNDDWDPTDATLDTSGEYIKVTTNSADSQLKSPDDLNIDGSRFTHVVFRMRRTASDNGHDFETPVLFYKTDEHDFLHAYRKAVGRPLPLNQWITFTFDMTKLTAGGDDWVNSTIQQLRLDVSFQEGDAFDIDFVALGEPGQPTDGIESSNLINDEYFTSSGLDSSDDTDDEFSFKIYKLDDLGLKPGDIVSASFDMRTTGTRRGRIGIYCHNYDGETFTKTSERQSGWTDTGGDWKSMVIDGYTIPPDTNRIKVWLLRENTGASTGQVSARRPVLNRGGKAVLASAERPDVEIGATVGADWDDSDSLLNRPSDDDLLNSNQQWTAISSRPTSLSGLNSSEGSKLSGIASNATRNTGDLADEDSVSRVLLDAGAVTDGLLKTSNISSSGTLSGSVTLATFSVDVPRHVLIQARVRIKADTADQFRFYLRLYRGSVDVGHVTCTATNLYRAFKLFAVDETVSAGNRSYSLQLAPIDSGWGYQISGGELSFVKVHK